MSSNSSSQRRALWILCLVFFLIPFGLRGARNALENIKNDPNDWLPADFPETKELKWFARHFIGEKFVMITWPGCIEGDPSFQLFIEKLRRETAQPIAIAPVNADRTQGPPAAGPPEAADAGAEVAQVDPQEMTTKEIAAALQAQGKPDPDLERARQTGDRLGLFYNGHYNENWGDRNEKWLQGHKDSWYFITPKGELYRWKGGSGLIEGIVRGVKRSSGNKKAPGELIETFGIPSQEGYPNPFHKDPGLLTGRVFSTLTTGPQLLAEMAAKDGPLWKSLSSSSDYSEDEKPLAVRAMAYTRLTGSLFGPPPHEAHSVGDKKFPRFDWTPAALLELLTEQQRAQLPENWEDDRFQFFVETYTLEKLRASTGFQRELHWARLFKELGVDPPARQTCLIATLSDLGKADMARVVGRPILGKPRGVVQAVAEQCGISTDEKTGDLKLGGPPVDNVAIDEEGTRTLVNLVGLSAIVGFALSFACFRSVLVTLMVFVVGGVSAITGLAIVYYSGSSVDAILMSMPAVVYVLGLSGAVHIVNYYRDALRNHSVDEAPWVALRMGWWPCTLAAFTTAIGLISLNYSNIVPIQKFGLYSAIGVLATLMMLFFYLPSALVTWPAGFHLRNEEESRESWGDFVQRAVTGFWAAVGGFVVKRHAIVTVSCIVLTAVVGCGLFRIDTSVKLMKLFDPGAKIIADYYWLEEHLGKLVPMELVIRVAPERLSENAPEDESALKKQLRLNLLERMEIADRVQRVIETQYGPRGKDYVGPGLSPATFFHLPEPAPAASLLSRGGRARSVMTRQLAENYDELLKLDYLRVDKEEPHRGSELWRISLRLGALNDVDYGTFVNDLKVVAEPVMSAYRYRDEILSQLHESDPELSFSRKRILFLGLAEPVDPVKSEEPLAASTADAQTTFCFTTLRDLLMIKGFANRYAPTWHDPSAKADRDGAETPGLDELIADADCVVLARADASYDLDSLRDKSKIFVDARDHVFDIDIDGGATQPIAAKRGSPLHIVYTGAVPVIYKAQRTLLVSLMNSIALAFVLIAAVMMLLLRNGPLRPTNLIGARAGMVSMLPNVFPVVLIFGAMGFLGLKVDIGTMMTASVAMGVAVDDTIHFLIWFRKGVAQGLSRHQAIALSYKHVATAMTQTTLIGGLGLSVFFASTFTPTQRFGILMLVLLVAALVGDLIFLPALLAGPLGKYFCPRDVPAARSSTAIDGAARAPSLDQPEPVDAKTSAVRTPHSRISSSASGRFVRRDAPHRE